MYTIVERVGAYMAKTGKSRERIAQDLGMTRRTFSKKLQGKSEFRFSEACQLADMLGCSVGDFKVGVGTTGLSDE